MPSGKYRKGSPQRSPFLVLPEPGQDTRLRGADGLRAQGESWVSTSARPPVALRKI